MIEQINWNEPRLTTRAEYRREWRKLWPGGVAVKGLRKFRRMAWKRLWKDVWQAGQ